MYSEKAYYLEYSKFKGDEDEKNSKNTDNASGGFGA